MAHTYNSSTLGGLRWVDHLRSGVQDQPGQHGETLSLLKIQKSAGCGGTHLLSQLLRRLTEQNCLNPGGRGCSEPRSCHCTPAWETEQDSVSKTKTKDLLLRRTTKMWLFWEIGNGVEYIVCAKCFLTNLDRGQGYFPILDLT